MNPPWNAGSPPKRGTPGPVCHQSYRSGKAPAGVSSAVPQTEGLSGSQIATTRALGMGAGLREQRPCHMPTTRGPPRIFRPLVCGTAEAGQGGAPQTCLDLLRACVTPSTTYQSSPVDGAGWREQQAEESKLGLVLGASVQAGKATVARKQILNNKVSAKPGTGHARGQEKVWTGSLGKGSPQDPCKPQPPAAPTLRGWRRDCPGVGPGD